MSSFRQLAAIMFTDIVGYTTLMGDDEQKAFELLKKNRQLQRPIIEKFNGTWIKEIGDGVLASFHTVTDAVMCAIEIQQACEKIDDLKLRIGIHLGEVVFEDNDVFGDGVNIASRLQALAPIGGTWISESVYKNVSNKKEIITKFIREEHLKNVKEPIRIYEVICSGVDANANESKNKDLEKSIAVLPFVDMSPAHDQEYLGDGLAEELINLLSQIKELKVAGRTSSFSFKKKDVDIKTIGKALNANTILEGSVQKAANRIRITAQLVNAADGYHIWSHRYDREMDDIFALQDDIASKIAEHLRITLLDDHETAVEKRPTNNLQAYEMFLKGEFHYKKYSGEGFEKAIEYFQNAIELDPDYAEAWAALGQAYWETQAWLPLQDASVVEKSRQCAKKAIAINESVAYAHFMLAIIHMNKDWDWEKAAVEIRLGNKYNRIKNFWFVPLEPWYRAMIYGDFNFAITKMEKAIENDPLSIFYLLHLALICLYELHDYKKTRALLNRILELDAHYSEAWRPMCLSFLFEGNYVQAEEYARKYYDALQGRGQGAANLIICLAASGKKEEAQELYRQVNENPSPFQFSSSLHAKVNAFLGNLDEAFDYLDKAFEERDIWLSVTLQYSPEWDLFRPDPRFQKVLERMKFPETNNLRPVTRNR